MGHPVAPVHRSFVRLVWLAAPLHSLVRDDPTKLLARVSGGIIGSNGKCHTDRPEQQQCCRRDHGQSAADTSEHSWVPTPRGGIKCLHWTWWHDAVLLAGHGVPCDWNSFVLRTPRPDRNGRARQGRTAVRARRAEGGFALRLRGFAPVGRAGASVLQDSGRNRLTAFWRRVRKRTFYAHPRDRL